jgi:hypothetical protein
VGLTVRVPRDHALVISAPYLDLLLAREQYGAELRFVRSSAEQEAGRIDDLQFDVAGLQRAAIVKELIEPVARARTV